MKKILCIVLTMLIVLPLTSVVSTSAISVAGSDYDEKLVSYFETNAPNVAVRTSLVGYTIDGDYIDCYGDNYRVLSIEWCDSTTPTEYYNEFGLNNKYYEKSDVTYPLFPSGTAVYNETTQSFLTLEQWYEENSQAFEEFFNYRKVGMRYKVYVTEIWEKGVPLPIYPERVLEDYLINETSHTNTAEFTIKEIGTFGDYTLMYGVVGEGTKANQTVEVEGCFSFVLNTRANPYILGLYFVKDDVVCKFMDAYRNDVVSKRDIYLAGVALNQLISNGETFNFTIHFDAYDVVMTNTPIKLKAGAVSKLFDSAKIYKYTSSDVSVATVANGTVKALKKGNTTVTAYLTDGSKIVTKVVVTTDPVLAKRKITLNKNKTKTIKVKGAVGKVKFTSKNTKVATVNKNGKLTAKGKGNTIIKVKVNGITLKCKVKVK